MNREQFYVSISRGRERCHVFTDDADLLARRVTDSHERKAAVELQALRDDLAKLGFLLRRQLKEEAPKITTQAPGRFRALRPLRETRATRLTRLAPGQRFVQIAEYVRQWLDDKLGLERKEVVTEKVIEKVTPTKCVKQTEKSRRSLSEEVRQHIEQHRHQRQQPRLSRGIGH